MKKVIAIVGMPGSGKSEAGAFFKNRRIPIVRFGDLTEETLEKRGLKLTQENERIVREELRKEFGMAAFAVKAKPKIEEQLKKHALVVLDGLYSWEEYVYLVKYFPHLIIVHIFANPKIRYARLANRVVRPLTFDEARSRDMAEIENLHKSGPIAMADYLIMNEKNLKDLHLQLGRLLKDILN